MTQIYTVKELQKILKVGHNKAYELVATGEIKSIKVGRRILIPEIAIKNFINEKLERN